MLILLIFSGFAFLICFFIIINRTGCPLCYLPSYAPAWRTLSSTPMLTSLCMLYLTLPSTLSCGLQKKQPLAIVGNRSLVLLSLPIIIFGTGDVYIVPFRFLYISKLFCIHFHILPCCLAVMAKQHGRIWKWQRIAEVGLWEVP